jgi:hypothetical protein
MRLQMQIFSDVGCGAESDQCRSGCGLVYSDNTCLYSVSNETNDALRRTAARVFYAHAHTIYIAKILWVKNYVHVKGHSV